MGMPVSSDSLLIEIRCIQNYVSHFFLTPVTSIPETACKPLERQILCDPGYYI